MADVNFIDGADASTIADWIADRLNQVLSTRSGQVTICVSGGSTPISIFRELVTHDLDFARICIWPNDDRIVAEDHEASNTGMIRAIFEPTGAYIVGLPEAGTVPRFDLMWLGMGDDGHIASLFPNTDPDPADPQAIRQLTPDPLPAHAPFDRITLTLPALTQADTVMFVIRGSEKRSVFDAAVAGENDLPIARFLRMLSQPVTCFT